MARPVRIEFPGALYHVTSRGIERRDIFRDDTDRRRFVTVLAEAVDRFGWIVSAYVLMSNHFHLLFELTLPTLSRGMQWLNSKYAQAFNKRYGRVGHLVQSRPDARLIQKETYFLNVLRYVVLNPVRANMVPTPDQYEWSSYRATAGLLDAPEWLSADEILKNFGEYRDIARQRYQRYVMDGIGGPTPWADLVGQIYLGSEEWVGRIREKVESRPRDSEHPSVQRCVDRWTMIDVLSSVAAGVGTHVDVVRNSRGGTARMLAAWLGSNDGFLTLSSIAAGLRLRSTGHVSELIRACDKELASDESLRAQLQQCRELLYLL